jgi:3-oxoacyl-(acyl-carrier-protein) synthase
MSGRRRVVVTGLGLVTPLATGVNATWGRLLAGECGIRRITQFDVNDLPAKIAANVQRGTSAAHPSDQCKCGCIFLYLKYIFLKINISYDDQARTSGGSSS